MKRWTERPPEVAYLLNPAFLSLVIREFTEGYRKEGVRPLEFALIFLAVPLVMHGDTRRALPSKIVTKHHVWIENNAVARVGVVDRCKALVPYVKEALTFGINFDVLAFAPDLSLVPGSRKVSAAHWENETEPAACMKSARFLGRWFAQAGNSATVFAQWGVRP